VRDREDPACSSSVSVSHAYLLLNPEFERRPDKYFPTARSRPREGRGECRQVAS
jgi:hypothetical protein